MLHRCPSCSKKVESNWFVCPNCGLRVRPGNDLLQRTIVRGVEEAFTALRLLLSPLIIGISVEKSSPVPHFASDLALRRIVRIEFDVLFGQVAGPESDVCCAML